MQVKNYSFIQFNPKYVSHLPIKSMCESTSSSVSCNFLPKDTVHFSGVRYDKGLSKLHDITKAEYHSLTHGEKKLLRKKIDNPKETLLSKSVKKDIEYHYFAAEAIKQVFDKQYGAGNYVVVTLGRSLSSISKLLELKIGAENVKNIPMSKMSDYSLKGMSPEEYNLLMNRFVLETGFDNLKKYLSSIGLRRDIVENSGKNYVIMDFISSGRSLENGYSLLTSNHLLGNKKRNITFVSMFDVANATGKPVETCILDSYLDAGLFKKYSFVDRIEEFDRFDSAVNIDEFSTNPKRLECKKLFGFALLDSFFSGKKSPFSEGFKFLGVSEKTPHSERLKGKVSDSAHKKVWYSYYDQFEHDVLEDRFELLKIIDKTGDSVKNKQFRTLLHNLDTKYFSDDRPIFVRSEEYYTKFRAKLLQIIESAQK